MIEISGMPADPAMFMGAAALIGFALVALAKIYASARR